MKQGQYFILEAFIGLIILGLALTFLFFVYKGPELPEASTQYRYALDVATQFETPISQITEGLCAYDGLLVQSGDITALDNTFFEQVGEFYDRETQGCTDCAMYIQTCLDEFVIAQSLTDVSFNVSVDHTILYTHRVTTEDKASIFIPIHILLFGVTNNQDPWGPYEGEILVWK